MHKGCFNLGPGARWELVGQRENGINMNRSPYFHFDHLYTLVNVYVDLVVFTRIAGTLCNLTYFIDRKW